MSPATLAFEFRSVCLRPLAAILLAAALCLSAGPAGAQPSSSSSPLDRIAPEFLDNPRRIAGDELHFCLNTSSVLVALDRAVSEAVAGLLFLRPVFYDVEYPGPRKVDYRIPLTPVQLFSTMNNRCDVFAGYRINAGILADWLTVSRPYFRSSLVMASLDPAVRRLEDLAAGEKIGVRLGGTGHRELRTYLDSLPSERRQRQIPYPDNDVLVERLFDRSVAAILVWEYAPGFLPDRQDGQSIASVFAPPFSINELQFSFAMMNNNTFIRSTLDSALDALQADGTLDALIRQHLPPPLLPSH